MAPLTTASMRLVWASSAIDAATARTAIRPTDTQAGTMNFQMNGQSDGRVQPDVLVAFGEADVAMGETPVAKLFLLRL